MARKICVITGGGSGMGLEAAKCMPMDHALVISGRTREKLQKAAEELASSGHEVFVAGCVISNRESVQ